MEKTHKRKLYRKLFRNETIPKMHGFVDGIKDLDIKDIEQISINTIKKAKENKIYRNGTIDGIWQPIIDNKPKICYNIIY